MIVGAWVLVAGCLGSAPLECPMDCAVSPPFCEDAMVVSAGADRCGETGRPCDRETLRVDCGSSGQVCEAWTAPVPRVVA